MSDNLLQKYEILTNRSPFNNAIWHQEKSKRLFTALAEIARICGEHGLLESTQAVSTSDPDRLPASLDIQHACQFHLDEALQMAFTLYFFAIGRTDGYGYNEADNKEIIEYGAKGLLKVMEQYDELFQEPPTDRFWPPFKEPTRRKGPLLQLIKRREPLKNVNESE